MIDITFDFTTDSPRYWDGFWDRNDGLGCGGCDPDSKSPALNLYHSILWSKQLPNGEYLNLKREKSPYHFSWNSFYFSSDSIIVGLRYQKYKHIIEQVKERVGDYKTYYEDLIRKSYTIGGMIIFPIHPNSINQRKGCNPYISDRWDLTMECIRRFYLREDSPLYKVLLSDKDFFDLFVDFKGYVDFFLLQDCVSSDYAKVDIWCGDTTFKKSGLPETVDDYFTFIDKEFKFLEKRNLRIKEYCTEHNL